MVSKQGISVILMTNLMNPYEINMKQLANIILNLTKLNSRIVYKELSSRKPDISRAKNIETIEYFSQEL